MGDNLTKAVRTFEPRMGLGPDGEINDELWAALSKDSAPVLQSYKVTKKDLSQEFIERVPKDYAQMAKMKWLGYTGLEEMLAERFHMDQSLLERLNPHVSFKTIGTELLVASPGKNAAQEVSRIVVDRSDGELFAFAGARLVASYPPQSDRRAILLPPFVVRPNTGEQRLGTMTMDP